MLLWKEKNIHATLQTVEEFDDVEVVVPGRPSAKVNRKRDRAEKLFLHYIQRWAKDYLRRRLDWMVEDMYGSQEYASNTNPRHIRSALCPCQVRRHFMYCCQSRMSVHAHECSILPSFVKFILSLTYHMHGNAQ